MNLYHFFLAMDQYSTMTWKKGFFTGSYGSVTVIFHRSNSGSSLQAYPLYKRIDMSVSSPAGKHEALSKASWLEVCKRTGTNCSHRLPALATSAKPLPDSSQIFTRAE